LRIEFEEGVRDGQLGTNPRFEIRNPQFLSWRRFNGQHLANGERRTANGERQTANGERQTVNGER
jgi:hypothetical protein